jgi:hypothetical protein
VNERRRSSFALHGRHPASLGEVDLENERRSDILIVWQKLQATSGDAGWLKVIEDAYQDQLDLDFPTAAGETVRLREKSQITRGCRKITTCVCTTTNPASTIHPHVQHNPFITVPPTSRL